jgi:membrane-associated protease RseP (regulator of RpoE activity)
MFCIPMKSASRMTCGTLWATALISTVPLAIAASQSPATPATTSASPAQTSRPWFGFSIACSECRSTESSAGTRWEFSSPPAVQAVEKDSPAGRAGMRAGDLLLAINGRALTSEAGTTQLAMIRAGQEVVFRVKRELQTLEMRMTATTYPMTPVPTTEVTAQPGPSGLPAGMPLRFEGGFGQMQVSVRGPANTAVLIVDKECWMEIRSGGAVVRLENRDGCPRR